jgi:hypothetical protein
MIRVTVSYSRPKSIDIEMAILLCLSPFHGSKLGEFGFIDNRFEVLVGFKKESLAIGFQKEVLKLNQTYQSAKIQVTIAKIKDP